MAPGSAWRGHVGAPQTSVRRPEAVGRHAHTYALYRASQVDHEPQFFVLRGQIAESLDMVPVTYRAQVAADWKVEQ